MLVEIEVEDVGIVRPLNMWQIERCMRTKGSHNRRIAWAAESVCMSLSQFKRLSPEKQGEVIFASNYLSSADNTASAKRYPPVTYDELIRGLKQAKAA